MLSPYRIVCRRLQATKQSDKLTPKQSDEILASIKSKESDCDQLLRTIDTIAQRSHIEQVARIQVEGISHIYNEGQRASAQQQRRMEELEDLL